MGEPKPPRTAPIGLETRNWLWKRVDLTGNELALNTNCEDHRNTETRQQIDGDNSKEEQLNSLNRQVQGSYTDPGAPGEADAATASLTQGLLSSRNDPMSSLRSSQSRDQSRDGSSESIEKDKDDVQVEKAKKEQNPASSYEMTKQPKTRQCLTPQSKRSSKTKCIQSAPKTLRPVWFLQSQN